MNWRPISEAPKDASQVVWYQGNWYEATHFDGEAWITVCDHIIAPTLYLPITPPGEQPQPESVNQRLLDAAEAALRWVESDEATHGRRFATGNVLRAAIDAAKQAKQ